MKKNKENQAKKSWLAPKDTVQDIRDTDSEEYAARTRRSNVFFRILSVICAIGIWVFAVSSSTATKEITNFPVTVKGVNIVQSRTYNVEYDVLRVNYKLQGNVAKISQVQEKELKVYADLSSIDLNKIEGSQTFELALNYEVPNGLACLDKSQDTIHVVITKKSAEKN